jgi:flagellar basal-body rod protein FlgG
MVRGLYIAGTGMMLQRRTMEVVTNNIANADTTGYKKDFLVSHSFDSVLIRRINDNATVLNRAPHVGPLHLGTQVDQKHIDFDIGNLEVTERTSDLALIGDAFFVIETADGERYTKNGAFYIDSHGYLVDGHGNFLLGENGPIYVGGPNFSVSEQGGVWVNNQLVDIIRTVSFEDNQTLRKQGGSIFFATEEPIESNPYLIRQGVLEASNVEVAREMVDMITLYRTYETNQRMITLIDESVGKAVNEIGRLR